MSPYAKYQLHLAEELQWCKAICCLALNENIGASSNSHTTFALPLLHHILMEYSYSWNDFCHKVYKSTHILGSLKLNKPEL
jgi:hypothetical protein